MDNILDVKIVREKRINHTEFTLYSDGELEIEPDGDGVMIFSKEEVEEIRKVLGTECPRQRGETCTTNN